MPKPSKPPVSVTCEICGKNEDVPQYRAPKYKTCSIECRTKRSSILYSEGIEKECDICGVPFKTKKSHVGRRKTCSKSCDGVRKMTIYKGVDNPNYNNRGENNPLFKGGRRMTSRGYVEIYKPDHPNANDRGYVLEHRYVVSSILGRPLKTEEDVHHIDENKTNNSPENLLVMTRSEHSSLHNKKKIIIRDSLGRISGVKKKEAE